MNRNPNMAGLAGLLASQGQGEDKVLVHMTPGEVRGLQALAQATGGSLSVNPNTGLLQAGWLKNLLPAIAGFTLNRVFPGLGSTATSALVGTATGLIEGSFKKGLNAGFGAYSGSNISEGLRRAAAVRMAPPKTLSQQLGLKEEELLDYGDLTKPDTDKQTFGVRLPQTTTPLPAISPVTPKPSKSGIFEGIRGLATEQGRKAFTTGLEGGYTSPFGKMASKYATSMGLQTMLTPDYDEGDMKGGQMTKPRYYIPGDYNPNYGKGYGEWLFKPGYFADKYPGYADGGMVFQGDERFADGGEVMVSPGAVLPQRVTTYQPSFTQDRAGLGQYYESLLVPPDTTPRDTSALQAYLDELRARLKRPYQPYGLGPEVGGGTGGGGGGGPGSGGTVTPPGVDPFATGVTGTPIEFIQPPAPPAPPKPKEELTPPSSVAPGARPEDLGNLFTTPTTINVPQETVSVLPLEQEVIPDVAPEEMYQPDINQVLQNVQYPDYLNLTSEPEKEASYSVTPIEELMVPDVTPEEMYQPNISQVLAGVPEPLYIQTEPEKEASYSVTPIEELMVPDVTPEEMYQPNISDVIQSIQYPDYLNLTPEPERSGSISYREMPVGYDFVDLGFINPQTTDQVADASKPIVDEILKNFEEQQKAEKEEKVEKAKEAGTNIIELLAKVSPEVALAYEAYKYLFTDEKPKEKEATVKVEEVPEQPPQTTSGGGGGMGLPINPGSNFNVRNLINPVEVEEGYQPDFTVGVEELGMAGGGMVPRYAQGGLGSLQQYAVGGKLVNGRGDGMSDDIKANIGGHQEARLADGEFVIPADVVSHLGNGSTDAGAKQLYAMMDRIRKARTGRERQAPEVSARNYMPA